MIVMGNEVVFRSTGEVFNDFLQKVNNSFEYMVAAFVENGGCLKSKTIKNEDGEELEIAFCYFAEEMGLMAAFLIFKGSMGQDICLRKDVVNVIDNFSEIMSSDPTTKRTFTKDDLKCSKINWQKNVCLEIFVWCYPSYVKACQKMIEKDSFIRDNIDFVFNLSCL